MLILNEQAVSAVMTALVNCTHNMRDHNGKSYTTGTIDPKTLRGSVMAALTTCLGQPVDTEFPIIEPFQNSDPRIRPTDGSFMARR